MIKHDYTFIHFPMIPVLESEITALTIIKYNLESKINLPISYCSGVYKRRFHYRGFRRQAAHLVKEDFEGETYAGFIRQLSIKDSLENLKEVIRLLIENKCPDNLMSLNNAGTELFIHHSLLKYIDFNKYNLILHYFDPEILYEKKRNGKEIRVNANTVIYAAKDAITGPSQIKLSSTGIESFKKLYLEKMNSEEVYRYFFRNYTSKTKETKKNFIKELESLMKLENWEQIPEGFPDIY